MGVISARVDGTVNNMHDTKNLIYRLNVVEDSKETAVLDNISKQKYTATDVATWFLRTVDREAGESITHLKLQKLIYYAEAWSVALLDRELFDESFQAWAHGPVAVSVYDQLKDNGWQALSFDVLYSVAIFDEDTEHLLNEVQDVYGSLQAKDLEEMTHQEEPWREARGNLPIEARSATPISKETMARFYKTLYQSVNGEK